MPANHIDSPKAYAKAEKEEHLYIYLHLPSGISVSEETLREQGAASANELVLDFRKNLYGLKLAGRL